MVKQTMELYLFRHGIADDARPGQPDAERALTEHGRKKVAEVVKTARKAGVDPSLIVSSPYKRAVETARLAIAGFEFEGEFIQTAALVPHGHPEAVWRELREYRDQRAILLTGHEPLLSHLVAYCLASPALRVEMKKAAMVRIDFDTMGASPNGMLRWMIYPNVC